MTLAPDVDDHHVLWALAQLMDATRELLLADGEPGLRPSHHRVLGHVPPGGITVTDLAARVGMTKQGIGQFVSQLSETGHLSVAREPEDRRIRTVRRTPKGRASVRRLARQLAGIEQAWAEQVGQRRYAQFRRVLDDLAAGPQPGIRR